MVFRGLTWDHPRGYQALHQASIAVNRSRAAPLLHWQTRSLESFESSPIANLAHDYDLLVLDHPHLGDAIQQACLQPLSAFFSQDQLAQWETQSLGQAMKSYQWQHDYWALPLDVASQVLAYRSDLLGNTHFTEVKRPTTDASSPPCEWADIIRLSEKKSVALSLQSPHAFLSFYALCIALGKTHTLEKNLESPEAVDNLGQSIFEGSEAIEALTILQRLYRRIPRGSQDLNPIELLTAMAQSNEITLVPLVFGYVNYSCPHPNHSTVLFANAPTIADVGVHGSVLGGTGIGLCKGSRPSAALLDHLIWLMDETTQRHFIPRHSGQPSTKSAWQDAELNRRSEHFYQNTLNTVEHAVIRPRHPGYIPQQTRVSARLNRGLSDGETPSNLLKKMRSTWLRTR